MYSLICRSLRYPSPYLVRGREEKGLRQVPTQDCQEHRTIRASSLALPHPSIPQVLLLTLQIASQAAWRAPHSQWLELCTKHVDSPPGIGARLDFGPNRISNFTLACHYYDNDGQPCLTPSSPAHEVGMSGTAISMLLIAMADLIHILCRIAQLSTTTIVWDQIVLGQLIRMTLCLHRCIPEARMHIPSQLLPSRPLLFDTLASKDPALRPELRWVFHQDQDPDVMEGQVFPRLDEVGLQPVQPLELRE